MRDLRGTVGFLLAAAAAVFGAVIPASQTSGATAPAGVITGQVTGADTGGGLSGICVFAVPPTTSLFGPGTVSTTSGALGFYELTGLDVGTGYTIFFGDCNSSPRYAEQWWPDEPFGPGRPVTPPQSGVNAVLSVGATIEGKVTDSFGLAVSGICVTTFPGAQIESRDEPTDSSGRFVISPLPPATYKIDYGCGEGWPGSSPLKDWWWDNEATQASADAVTLSPGEVFVANETVPEPGVLKGAVTNATTGSPVSGICVNVTEQNGKLVGTLLTTSSGTWDVEQLPLNIPLYVEFNGGVCGANPSYATQWWQAKRDVKHANAITLTNTAPIATGMNASLSPSP